MPTRFENSNVGDSPVGLQDLPSGLRTYPVMHPHLKLPTVFEQVCEQTGSCSYMHSSMSRHLRRKQPVKHHSKGFSKIYVSRDTVVAKLGFCKRLFSNLGMPTAVKVGSKLNLRVIIVFQKKAQRTCACLMSIVRRNTHFRVTFIFKIALPFDWASIFIVSFRAVFHAITDVFPVHTVSEGIADEVVLSFASVLIFFAMYFAVHFVFTVRAVSD